MIYLILLFIFYQDISHANDMAFVQDMMTQYPVISLVVASLLCFGLVLFVSNLTISSTGKQKQGKQKQGKRASKSKSKGKTPTRRAKSPAGARRSTRKRTAVKAHNVSDVSGQSY